ncbi:MAG: phage virion morphogenesis protein [Candidatus Dadabacteria bacterium]|nr:phage virion morphogenesis protein [Candidatus Dadabacteria bacterium]
MFRVAVNTREIDGLAVRLARRSTDLSEAMTKIAGIMLDAVGQNFEDEGRPPWTPLADPTKEQRTEEGWGPEHPILQRTGTLAVSVQEDSSRNEATVATNLRYAAIQHFGGEAGRGKKVKIPPRPFLVLAPEAEAEIADVLRKLVDKDLSTPP